MCLTAQGITRGKNQSKCKLLCLKLDTHTAFFSKTGNRKNNEVSFQQTQQYPWITLSHCTPLHKSFLHRHNSVSEITAEYNVKRLLSVFFHFILYPDEISIHSERYIG